MVYIFLYLFLEVMVSTFFASMLGGLLTFVEIVFSAIIGIYILQTFKYSMGENIRELASGNITQDEFFAKNMNKAVGAIMLIIPGFFTDIVGLLLLFGLFTFILTKLFSFKTKKNNTQTSYNTNQQTFYYTNNTNYENTKRSNNDEDIIDVEVIDTTDSIKH